MFEPLEKLIGRLLKVPAEPEPPVGAPESVRVFRAAPGYFRYRLLSWGLRQVSAAIGLVVGFFIIGVFPDSWQWARTIELLGIAGFFAQLPFSFLLVALDYRYRWYVTTDRSLLVREGIWKVQERTMTYSNLQNVSIRQGPLQRFFEIADLEVRTAGGGSKPEDDWNDAAENLHVGYFRGVDNADELKERILDQLRRARAAGLGDPDEPPPEVPVEAMAGGELPPSGDGSGLLAAAREVLAEVRSLRGDLARG